MMKLRRKKWPGALALGAMLGAQMAATLAYARPGNRDSKGHGTATVTPIKHLIVLIGENRTFDHVFATYEPRHGDDIGNLLSKQIIKADGSPGSML
jgi:phospholipase C